MAHLSWPLLQHAICAACADVVSAMQRAHSDAVIDARNISATANVSRRRATSAIVAARAGEVKAGVYASSCYICQTKYMSTQIHGLETLFKALADGTRLRILGLLLAGEVCVCDIHETLSIPQPKASRHLAYLRKSGLVDVRREGLWMHYRLAESADPVVRAVIATLSHALTHVDAVKRDSARLERATGCCIPAQTLSATTLPCCAPKGARARGAR